MDFSLLKDIRVLLAEDDKDSRDVFSILLRQWGAEVVPAGNGSEALALFQNRQADLLISDIGMPVMSGLELAQAIRKLDSGIPIILASGAGDRDNLLQALESGVNSYVFKPVEHDKLYEVVAVNAQVVRQRREKAAIQAQLKLAAKVFETSGEAIVISDHHYRVVSVNQSFSKVTGYEPPEVVGKKTRVVKFDRHDKAFYRNIWNSLKSSGRWQGETWGKRKNGETYPQWMTVNVIQNDDGKVANYLATFSDITERKAAEKRIRYLAYHDTLTGLPNRLLFHERLADALAMARRNRTQAALLFIDLDRFKPINDTFGHVVGDQVLAGVAARLKGCCREIDTVARIGGDEFVVILRDVANVGDVACVAGKIVAALAPPYLLDGRSLECTPSIGISIYPHDGQDEEALIHNADAAMYHTKENGGSHFTFFAETVAAGGERP